MADLRGQPREIVYKTLVTVAKSKEHYVFVIPIEAELDLKKAARAVHEKSVEMLPLKELTDLTGYVRGGCTCIGMKKQFPAVLDESAKQFPRIMVSGGRRGSQIEVNPEDLMRAAGGTFADVVMEKTNHIIEETNGAGSEHSASFSLYFSQNDHISLL